MPAHAFSRNAAVAAVLALLIGCSAPNDGPETETTLVPDLTDLSALARPDSPNNWLVAPAGVAGRDDDAVELPLSAERLTATWAAVVARQARARVAAWSDDRMQVEAEQRSAVFGFVDDISFRALPVSAGRSTFVVYSRSRVGHWDMGVNRRRLGVWLAALAHAVHAQGTGGEPPG